MEEKKRVLIIYTGGTIGMSPSPKGYVPIPGTLLETLRTIPAFSNAALPEWELMEFLTLLDSSDITFREWNKIGKAIEEHYEAFDGFVFYMVQIPWHILHRLCLSYWKTYRNR